jgi:hypothetical protein
VYFARVVLDGGLDAYRGDGDDTWSYSDIEIN